MFSEYFFARVQLGTIIGSFILGFIQFQGQCFENSRRLVSSFESLLGLLYLKFQHYTLWDINYRKFISITGDGISVKNSFKDFKQV